jgi:hypothetical protein
MLFYFHDCLRLTSFTAEPYAEGSEVHVKERFHVASSAVLDQMNFARSEGDLGWGAFVGDYQSRMGLV